MASSGADVLACSRSGLSAIANLENGQHCLHMLVHGPYRDVQPGCDLAVGASEAQVVEDLALAGAETLDPAGAILSSRLALITATLTSGHFSFTSRVAAIPSLPDPM